VSATGESQGCQRPHRDQHATDDLHGLSLLPATHGPRTGDPAQLSGDPHQGDKPLHRPTSNGLPKRYFKNHDDEAFFKNHDDEAMMGG